MGAASLSRRSSHLTARDPLDGVVVQRRSSIECSTATARRDVPSSSSRLFPGLFEGRRLLGCDGETSLEISEVLILGIAELGL